MTLLPLCCVLLPVQVGAGNTPLHLAAFGGDFDVVRLLLAAHVQTLSAGTEVMAAARGQWGERHAGARRLHLVLVNSIQRLMRLYIHQGAQATTAGSTKDVHELPTCQVLQPHAAAAAVVVICCSEGCVLCCHLLR